MGPTGDFAPPVRNKGSNAKMALILLVSANTVSDPYPVYPLGMSLVGEAARRVGHDVKEWDFLCHGGIEELACFTKATVPDIIGVSLRNVDNADSQALQSYFAGYRQTVHCLKQCSDAPVILGGPAFSLFPEEMLEELGADYGIVGEGEEQFCRLTEQLCSGDKPDIRIQSYHTNSSTGIQLQAGRNSELAHYYLQYGGMLNLQVKRGCPWQCAYCSYPYLEGSNYRFRPPKLVAAEIQALISRYDADYYAITDSVFNDTEGHYLEVVEELVRLGIDTPWMAFFRPGDFQRDEIQLLRRSGLQAVEFGTDCSTDITLKAMQKGFTWGEVVDSNARFAEAGIACAHFVIFGGPGETEDTLTEGLCNLAELKQCVVFAALGVRIFPHTPIERRALQEGVINPEQSLLPPVFYFSSEIDQAKVALQISKSFSGHPARLFGESEQENLVQTFHKLGYRGPIWDLLLRNKSTRKSGGLRAK